MRRLLRPGAVIVAALICWFGVGGLQAASPVAAPAAVATYMHDDPHLAEGMSVAAERDPPAGYELDTAYDYDAFDRWSRGTLARPGLDSTPDPNTYDDSARLAQVVRGIATTERGVRATGETSVAFDHYGVAAKSGEAVADGTKVLKGPIADAVPRNLPEQLALGAARDGQGTVIMRNLADAPRLVANYGEGDWVKMQYVLRGTDSNVTVHYFRNLTSKMDVEFKFK